MTWEHIGKISAAIPSLRHLKHQYEFEVNHFQRGNSHTGPAAEEDIANLQVSYHRDAIHTYTPGRKLNTKNKPKEFIVLGTDNEKLSNAIKRWQTKHDVEVSTQQTWKDPK